MQINKKQDMYNKIRNIVGLYAMIPDIIFDAIDENYRTTKGQNDSFKLGYIRAKVNSLYSDIEIDIEEFDAEYGDELKLSDG